MAALCEVVAGALLPHHLKQEILDDHQQQEHLPLLPARHARQHVK